MSEIIYNSLKLRSRIQILRKQMLGISQDDLEFITGISQGKISGIETGRMNPSAADIDRLCRSLQINKSWLIGSGRSVFVSGMDMVDVEKRRKAVEVIQEEFALTDGEVKTITAIMWLPRKYRKIMLKSFKRFVVCKHIK